MSAPGEDAGVKRERQISAGLDTVLHGRDDDTQASTAPRQPSGNRRPSHKDENALSMRLHTAAMMVMGTGAALADAATWPVRSAWGALTSRLSGPGIAEREDQPGAETNGSAGGGDRAS